MLLEMMRRHAAPAVDDPRVLAAMAEVPRHRFVPAGVADRAYDDTPLPIGHGQTISQPYIVGLMTQLAEVDSTMKVLEIGTGSGYQAAVLAELTPHVYTIELLRPLADRARAVLAELGYATVRCRQGDGYQGWPEEAPFDRILVTAAPSAIPPRLVEQLRPGGRLVVPVGPSGMTQDLQVVTRDADGGVRVRTVLPVIFVPMLTREP
jgi:protein-L-isoaspartate(D-aspartate) O-methyltransferase